MTGLRVLDPGCGAGHYAAESLKLGAAEVVGVEGRETLLGAARERLGDGATSTITYRRMTLERFLSELLGAGFVLERLVEPRATGGARLVDPRRYDKTHSQPSFLAVRLRRG
ncbi:methyltransferase domain-containing protein [Streptomyces odontomachi]|uniref:methyltransferase domain-containing protein n=1 Tax=Streptomyces odontomachi TaxID=2944940 RepID=UPI0021096483|nr:methyltransferase domain-containing protein [Streptomyces sp. ODS25]